MGGTIDQIKGRIKEAAGVLAGNDDLKREGQVDQEIGKVKETAANVAAALSKAAEEVAAGVKEKIEKAADALKDV